MLYDKSDVAVVGAGNSAGQAVMYLAQCCPNRTVHLLVAPAPRTGHVRYLVGRIHATPNIKVHEGVQIAAVHGERRLESITLKAFQSGWRRGERRDVGRAIKRRRGLRLHRRGARLFLAPAQNRA